jgi:hypothetical protein
VRGIGEESQEGVRLNSEQWCVEVWSVDDAKREKGGGAWVRNLGRRRYGETASIVPGVSGNLGCEKQGRRSKGESGGGGGAIRTRGVGGVEGVWRGNPGTWEAWQEEQTAEHRGRY